MNRGLASLGLAPTANHGHFWDTAGGANPSPTRWTVANPAAEDGRPQRAAPTAFQEHHSRTGQQEVISPPSFFTSSLISPKSGQALCYNGRTWKECDGCLLYTSPSPRDA